MMVQSSHSHTNHINIKKESDLTWKLTCLGHWVSVLHDSVKQSWESIWLISLGPAVEKIDDVNMLAC